MNNEKKICPSCGIEKDVEEFGFRVNGIPRGWCKKCEVKNRVEKGYEHVRERFKVEAKYEVRNLLRRHKIKIKNCCFCGNGGMIHMHHIDYALPLTFIPLCTKCHGLIHRKDSSNSEIISADTKEKPQPNPWGRTYTKEEQIKDILQGCVKPQDGGQE